MKNAKNAVLSTKINSAPLYTIAHPERVIHFVATPADWPYCEERLREAKVVGIDSETRPVFNAKSKTNPCSLLQLAVRCAKGKAEVFVLDLLKLQPKLYNAALSKLFLSKQVIKLGQGLLNDLKDLVASYPAASCFSVAKAVVEVNDLSISLNGAHHAISLQKLAYFYINKRLTKTMQTSNWNRRPLSPSQLHYAASDALVLIDIYDELLCRLQVRMNGKFKVESVMNVLDVHVEAMPKCTLCYAVFETKDLLKKHRRECSKTVLSLSVCASCDEMLLLDAEAQEAHKSSCGRPAIEEDADSHSPDDISYVHVANVAAKSNVAVALTNRKRFRSDSGQGAAQSQVEVKAAQPSESKKLKQSNRKLKNKLKSMAKSENSGAAINAALRTPPSTGRRPPRKMSAGTLLAADDIWSEISMEVNSDQPTP